MNFTVSHGWRLRYNCTCATHGWRFPIQLVGAAAPPTLVSATPTSWLATPIFDRFRSFFGFEMIALTLSFTAISEFRVLRH